MPDRLMTLADNLVSQLAEAFPTATIAGRPLPVTVAWSADVNQILDAGDIAAPLVWVLDASDLVETDRGECREDFDILLVVQMARQPTLDDNQLARDMSKLTASLRDYCKTRDTVGTLALSASEVVPCVRAARMVARNHEEWHHNRRFFSELLTTWRRY